MNLKVRKDLAHVPKGHQERANQRIKEEGQNQTLRKRDLTIGSINVAEVDEFIAGFEQLGIQKYQQSKNSDEKDQNHKDGQNPFHDATDP